MCLIAFSYRQHKRYKYILIANRDEFYDRPTASLNWWEDHADIIAGRDLQAGGTWQGMNRTGHWAALTNYREPHNIKSQAPSRGDLVANFLVESYSTKEYLAQLTSHIDTFNGFNLLIDDGKDLGYISNRASSYQILTPGLYGLSNHLLNTPWPKVQKVKSKLAEVVTQNTEIDPSDLFPLLYDSENFPDGELPQTGVGLEWERILAPMFIESPKYGTRVSTVMLIDYDGEITLSEKNYKDKNINTFQFSLKTAYQQLDDRP